MKKLRRHEQGPRWLSLDIKPEVAPESITSFKDTDPDHMNFFLSNLYPLKEGKGVVSSCGIESNTVEAAYVSEKFDELELREEIAAMSDGLEAKRKAKLYLKSGFELRSDWNEVKIGIMTKLVCQKFINDSELANRLLKTDGAKLVEGNTWGDRFWGQSPVGYGENHLGIILMDCRRELGQLRTDLGRTALSM